MDFDKYKVVRNQVTANIRKKKLIDSKKKCELFNTNKKAFNGYLRRKQKLSAEGS
jgi:hypothetical protein